MNERFSKPLLIKACASKVGQSSSDTPAYSDFNETTSYGHHVYSFDGGLFTGMLPGVVLYLDLLGKLTYYQNVF